MRKHLFPDETLLAAARGLIWRVTEYCPELKDSAFFVALCEAVEREEAKQAAEVSR